MKKLAILLLLLTTTLCTWSQAVYPVRTQTVLVPPMPYSLSGFASEPGRMQLNIHTDDISLERYPVYFRLVIRGNGIKLHTRPDMRQEPYYLDGGTHETLTGMDLEALFDPNNLIFEGYSQQEYRRTGRLPEGVYRIGVELWDRYRKVNISQALPGVAVMYLTRAPRLAFPMDREEVDPQTSPNLRFSWTGSMPNDPQADAVYRFSLYEVRPEGRNPNEAVRVSPPVFTQDTKQPYLLYDMGMPPLEEGLTYAWQVQSVDPEGRARFQNDGLSKVHSFRYGLSCGTPTVEITKVGTDRIQLALKGKPNVQLYRIRYKSVYQKEWRETSSDTPGASLTGLAENTGYEIKAAALCGGEESDESRTLRCRTGMDTNYACGGPPQRFDLSNTEPLEELHRHDFFKAADFNIEVTGAEGGNGRFSGKGFALVPYLGFVKFMVEFKDIFINTDRRMTEGTVDFVSNLKSGALAALDKILAEDPVTDEEAIDHTSDQHIIVKKEIKSIQVNDSTVTVIDTGDKIRTIRVPRGQTVGIVSKDGKTAYVADTGSGQVYSAPAPSSGRAGADDVATAAQTGEHGTAATFVPARDQRYGFDAVPKDAKRKPKSYFPHSKGGDPIAWKSLSSERPDYLEVEIDGKPGDTLRYVRSSGMLAPSSRSKKGDRLLLAGLPGGEEEILTAAAVTKHLVNDSTVREVLTEAGAIGLVSYDTKMETVVLVSVNGAQCPNRARGVKEGLDELYAPAAVEWRVLIDKKKLKFDDLGPDSFDTGKKHPASMYTRDMNRLLDAYEKRCRTNKLFYYLFFVSDPGNPKQGYMPLTGQFGFIFNFGSDVKVLAHELGHGAFNLRHTFSKKAEHPYPQGTTRNLMDYSGGGETWKSQWDRIDDPKKMLIASMQKAKEGAMVIENSTRALARLIKTINCAHNSGKKEVKLYLPSSTIRGSVSGLVSELYLAGNPCAEDAEVKATLYEMFGEVVDLSDDYLEDVFSLENVGYDESTKIITFTGSKYKLLITGEKDALGAYNFAKNNLFGSLHVPKTPINFASLDDLQYSSPCELQYLSIDSRKDLLQKIQSETNWYNGSLKDSRQKITINVIATTHKDDRGDLLSFFDTNKELLKNLYDRIDDYRGEFVEEINSIYQNGKGALNNSTVVALGIRPGVTIENRHWLENFNFLWRKLNLRREHVSAEYISSEQVSVVLKKYDGPSYGLPSLFAEGEELCKGDPFDIIQGIDQQSGKIIDVPLICFLHESEETDREVMYNDAISAGKLGVDGALIYFSVKNLQGASAILKSEVTAQNVARLILGFGDLATLGLGKVCENDNSEFCQAYKDYEFYINMGLLSANILNEFPQLYKNLKKGLDDPSLTSQQKDGLKKVLGEADDILSQRQDFWTNYKSKYFPDGDWGKTEFVTEGIDYNTFKNSNPVIYNEMTAKYGSSEIAEEYLPGLIESGSSIPTKIILNKGDELYKIVPSGSDISGLSPYYLSKAELNFVKQNPEKLEQVLGLPLSSCSGRYDVYKIVAKENNLAVFEANIAPTKQYLKSNPSDFYSTTGGRKQTLLIDNGDTDLWEKSSSVIETIEPTVLPVIK